MASSLSPTFNAEAKNVRESSQLKVARVTNRTRTYFGGRESEFRKLFPNNLAYSASIPNCIYLDSHPKTKVFIWSISIL